MSQPKFVIDIKGTRATTITGVIQYVPAQGRLDLELTSSRTGSTWNTSYVFQSKNVMDVFVEFLENAGLKLREE